MSVQKINIVLFGPGKVGSTLVSRILKEQESLLKSEKDIRVSLVVSSSLVFIENEVNKNAWDVTFINSSKSERVANIVSYIQDNNFSNTIIIDTTKQSGLVNYYPYFIQSGLDVISLTSDINTLSQQQLDEIKISTDVYDRKFFRLESHLLSKEQASEITLENILTISKNINQNSLVKQAI